MFAFAAPFLSTGTACHLERLICTVGTCVTVNSVACGGSASSWHSMMSLILSALQVRLYRLQFRVGNRWDGGAPRHSSPASFSTLLPIQNHIALLMTPAASGYSSTATSHLQSWDGLTPRLSPPVALALQVCDRDSLRQGCLLHVLWLSIPCLQIISDRSSCLEIAALRRRFTSSNNCFDGCEAQRHCILSSTDYLSACCICAD